MTQHTLFVYVLCRSSANGQQSARVSAGQSLFNRLKFYVTDGWSVDAGFIREGNQIVSKTCMTRVEGENTRLRDYLARLHCKTLCYSKSEEMLRHSIRLLLHYLKFWDVPVPT